MSGGSRAHSSPPRCDGGFVLCDPDSAEGIPWATQPGGELGESLWEVFLPREGGTARLPLETPSGTAQMEQLVVLRLRRVALAVQNRHGHRPNVPLALGKGALPVRTHAPSAAKPASSPGWKPGISCLSFLSPGLTNADRNIRLINKRMGIGRGEGWGLCPVRWNLVKG